MIITVSGFSTATFLTGLFEVIKDNTKSFEKIYIINPRNPVGEESGRVNLCELVNRFQENDIIVWDNFPDDLVKRDIDNAQTVLELISTSNTGVKTKKKIKRRVSTRSRKK